MSRTTRRKKVSDNNNYYLHYTREEFEKAQVEYLAGDWRGKYTYTAWDGRVIERNRKWYTWEVTFYRDYDQYLGAMKAKYHADRTRKRCGGIPHWFRNIHSTRPLRRKHRREIQKALDVDNGEELHLSPFTRDLGWWYY